ncbi:methyltransferase family protein [sulfur-oxidizing endosymbiont of Gigantopelta aegis]|uniref:methyltransferase family protein n=1 Tax=sulfur-oxidizing endosymbiont of Gigantopelta aegis TaxID=2794934 RepID=UPI001FE72F18|nr:hypothetical protein [sulfur-oxidizing endosymbiont of Gigantopelta aegis]
MLIQTGFWLVIGAFVAYFVLHSLAASLTFKQWFAKRWPELMPYYRLAFNALAMLLLLPLLLVMFVYPGEPLWQWQGIAWYLSRALIVLSILGFFYSLKFYDLSEFWGTRQLKECNTSVHDQECFQISPLHRYVRHPWYFFALVIIWSRDFSTVQLLVNVLVTAYFIIGSWLEEKKLCTYHGEVYQRYQQQVAGLVPLPWKILSAEQARDLIENKN